MSERLFTCEECKYVFKKRSHLLRHSLIHTDERPYSCNICEKSFRSSSHLKRHAATHNGEKTFCCEYEGCEVSCVTEWNLKRHVKRTHMGKFKCKKCGEEFKKNKQLQEHTLSDHKNATICCEFPGCARVFSVAAKMRHHQKIHTGKGHICPVKDCSMKFSLWSECRLHAAQCKKKEVSCDVCGKVFMERSNLKAHKKIHSEVREVFQCQYEGCGRFYTKQHNLKVHVQSFHLNIRPYVCSKNGCNKRFHFQHLLRKHLDSHEANIQRPKQARKRKRPRRLKASIVSEITGYIPELWKHMTSDEMKAYVENNDDDSTSASQSAYPPQILPAIAKDSKLSASSSISSKQLFEKQEPDTESANGSVVEMIEIKPFLYKVIRPSRKTGMDVLQQPMLDSPVISDTTSSEVDTSRKIKRGKSLEECCVQLHNLLDRNRRSSPLASSSLLHDSCRLQSFTESDSSDSELQKKPIKCIV